MKLWCTLTTLLLITSTACQSTADADASADAAAQAGEDAIVAADTSGNVADVAVIADVSPLSDAAQGSEIAPTADVPVDSQPVADAAPPADAVVAADAGKPDNGIVADVPEFIPAAVYSTNLSAWTMQPKEETTRCVVKRLDNAGEIWINAISTKLAKGSHHLIVYRSDATVEELVPFKCQPFTETLSGGNIPLMITQLPSETLTLPKGVAFKFAAKQMIRLEAHYLNYFKDPIEAQGEVDFHTMKKSDVQNQADMLFYGTPDFSLPPGKAVSTPWNYMNAMPGTKVFALTGHTHALGTNVEIALAEGAVKADSALIYPKDVPYLWSEPPIVKYDPPLNLDDTHGVQYRCTWNNTTQKNVGFGESANSEMCFFWAYYYPSQGYRMCINPGKWKDQIPAPFQADMLCCPDSPLCDFIKAYLSNK